MKRKGINAAAWFYSTSFHSGIPQGGDNSPVSEEACDFCGAGPGEECKDQCAADGMHEGPIRRITDTD